MVRVSPAQPAVLLHELSVGSFDIKTIRLRHIWRKDGMTVNKTAPLHLEALV